MQMHPMAIPVILSGIHVEALTELYFHGALDIYNTFVGAGHKHLCCLIPLTLYPT